jgi:acyl-CoA thioester hydrolase
LVTDPGVQENPSDPALERWPVQVEIPVAWGEMDAFAHVNNTVYLRWFETARIRYFERAGILDRMEKERIGPILGRATIDYRSPVTYPDTVTVQATVARLGVTSYVMKYRAFSRAQNHGLVAEGESVVVTFDYQQGRKTPVDETLRAAILRLEAEGTGAAR